MELKEKKLRTASYKVACTSGTYSIEGVVNIDSDNQVTNIDNGNIVKNGGFVASFGLFGNSLSVNYNATLSTDERNEVNTLIDGFKSAAVE